MKYFVAIKFMSGWRAEYKQILDIKVNIKFIFVCFDAARFIFIRKKKLISSLKQKTFL